MSQGARSQREYDQCGITGNVALDLNTGNLQFCLSDFSVSVRKCLRESMQNRERAQGH